MWVEVQCFGAMRDYLGGASLGEADVPEGASVADLIDRLGAPAHLVFSVLVNGSRAELDERLNEGDRVTLMPPFTGGSLTN